MQIVIDITDNEVPKRREIVEIGLQFMEGEVCECTYPFQDYTYCRTKSGKLLVGTPGTIYPADDYQNITT